MYSAEVPSRFGHSGISGSGDSLPVAVTVGKIGSVTPPTKLSPALLLSPDRNAFGIDTIEALECLKA